MFIYILIRLLTFPLSLMPYSWLHALGKPLGLAAYHLIPKYRKRALSNLALATQLDLSNQEIVETAKKSMQSLMITALEYPKLSRETDIHKIAICENPKEADHIMTRGKGVIFFCGHQANWELLFLEGTTRMKGVAIGRPIKNKHLYNWIQSIRQKFGGTIIDPKNAVKGGLKALRDGAFLGIVGDQGMPDSGFSSLFLGRLAWTSPLPALLTYKRNTPIIVATTRREEGLYKIHYSKALYPDTTQPLDTEVPRLMKKTLSLCEESIKNRPHEWMWIHNRWKQQTPSQIHKSLRYDSVAVFVPDDPKLQNELPLLKKIYPTEPVAIFTYPLDRPLPDHYLYKLIINFTQDKSIDKFYLKRAAQKVLHPKSIQQLLEIAHG